MHQPHPHPKAGQPKTARLDGCTAIHYINDISPRNSVTSDVSYSKVVWFVDFFLIVRVTFAGRAAANRFDWKAANR